MMRNDHKPAIRRRRKQKTPEQTVRIGSHPSQAELLAIVRAETAGFPGWMYEGGRKPGEPLS